MGLGQHGGGLAAARYAAARGASVTVTDLADAAQLSASLEQLPSRSRVVLGRHEWSDFSDADLVIKNPAVKRNSRYLSAARAITTDIALFLAEWRHSGPLVAITGTKGKSNTASAAAHILRGYDQRTRLGGNITHSPLEFIDSLAPGVPVVLELSSFQLGDLRFCREHNRSAATVPQLQRAGIHEVLQPYLAAEVAVITTIMPDHQDYYPDMESYVDDKREVYTHPAPEGRQIFGIGHQWAASFVANRGSTVWTVDPGSPDAVGRRSAQAAEPDATAAPAADGSYRLTGAAAGAKDTVLVPADSLVPGGHNRSNLAMAGLAAIALGMDIAAVADRAKRFPGVSHRLETVAEHDGLRLINDSAATIPQASLAGVRAFDRQPVVLIAGGSDKGLDLTSLREACAAAHTTVLLDGSCTERLLPLLAAECIDHSGPWPDLEQGFTAAVAAAQSIRDENHATEVVVLLSPGCASFGMFRNEFDRGDRFRSLAQRWQSAR